jgi:hypothetical protein
MSSERSEKQGIRLVGRCAKSWVVGWVVIVGALCPASSAAGPPASSSENEPVLIVSKPGSISVHYGDTPIQEGTKIPLGATLRIENSADSTFCELGVGSDKWRLDIQAHSIELPDEKVPPGPATLSICAHTDGDVCVPLATIEVELVSSTEPVRDRVSMTLQKHNITSLYWSMGGTIPFWIPVGLFGTNFQPINTGAGIPIAALPAGLAFGLKIRLGPNFFLGTSIFCNWSVQPRTGESLSALRYPGKGENIMPSPTRGGGSGQLPSGDVVGDSITLRALATGGLLDVGGYFVIGGAAAVEFTHGRPAVAPIFVIGAGYRFLQLLNGERQPSRER